jgi:hypothetical protein
MILVLVVIEAEISSSLEFEAVAERALLLVLLQVFELLLASSVLFLPALEHFPACDIVKPFQHHLTLWITK